MSQKGVNGVLNFPAPAGVPGSSIDFSGGLADVSITNRGSDWYWTVTAIMMTSTLAFIGLALTKPRNQRVFHYITAAITLVASIAYYSMASNLGWSPSTVEFLRDGNVSGTTRQIFYVRYIDWAITTPLLLLDLLLTSALPWPTVLWTILLDEAMIITGLVGALTPSTFKWGYYVIGCVAFLNIGYVVVFEARRHAQHLGSDIGRTFLICGTWTFALWTLYPIAWGLAEGGNVIAADSEAIFYGILDVLAKPVFGALLLWGHRNIDPARLGLHIRDYDEDLAYHKGTPGDTSEKSTTAAASHEPTTSASATNGTTGPTTV